MSFSSPWRLPAHGALGALGAEPDAVRALSEGRLKSIDIVRAQVMASYERFRGDTGSSEVQGERRRPASLLVLVLWRAAAPPPPRKQPPAGERAPNPLIAMAPPHPTAPAAPAARAVRLQWRC